ncbi:hypothetical protein AB837_00564 [bacterium AB1]|nr:hypothetical protein AB837_00564 [bacterium AB1]
MPVDTIVEKLENTNKNSVEASNLESEKVGIQLPFVLSKAIKNEESFQDIDAHEDRESNVREILDKFIITSKSLYHEDGSLAISMDDCNLMYHKLDFTEEFKKQFNNILDAEDKCKDVDIKYLEPFGVLYNLLEKFFLDLYHHMIDTLKFSHNEVVKYFKSPLLITYIRFGAIINSDVERKICSRYESFEINIKV